MPRYSYASIIGLASIVFVELIALLSFVFINNCRTADIDTRNAEVAYL
ncbi:conserved hypothetical protein [Vibrio diabolicus]|nr:conserved hypothetical protein [Vibrio diabolicus]